MKEKRKTGILQLAKNPKSILGVIISMTGIYWAFIDFNFNDFLLSIQQIDYIYLIMAALLLWSSVWLRGARWKLLFPEKDSPSISSLYKAEMIGYFGNNVLPLRLGELLRSYIVGKENSLSKSFVFGTVVLERLLDVLALAFLGLLLLFFYPNPIESDLKEKIMFMGVLSIVGISILFFILSSMNITPTENKVMKIIKKIVDGVLSIRKKMLLPIILTSLLIWFIYFMDVYLLQKAFQFNLSWSQILTVLVISTMAISIPSAPGMIGTFHFAVKKTMVSMFGFSANDGNSFAILMHAYGYILFTILGAYYFLRSQFHKQAIDEVMKTESENHR